MGKPLKPWTILAIGPIGVASAMALVAVGLRLPPLLLALIGALVGLVLSGGIAWAVRRSPGSPRILRAVARTSGRVGILGSAVFAVCAVLDHRGLLLVASGGAFFGGFFVGCIAQMRLETLDSPRSSDVPIS